MLAGLLIAALAAFPGQVFSGGLLDSAAALAIAFVVVYPFYALGGLKAGDGKLLMAVGALKGTLFLFGAAMYGALLGGLLAIGLVATRRLAPPETEVASPFWRVMKSRIPYGVALGAGALVALVLERAAA